MNTRITIYVTVILAVACSLSKAAPIAVPNFSFELPGNGPNGFGGTITSWADGDGGGTQAGTFNPTASRYPLTGGATDGDNIAFSNGPFISQTLAATYQPDTVYTLQVDVGDRNDTGFPGFDVQLRAGGIAVGSATAVDVSVPNGGFGTANVSFTASPGFVSNGSPIEIYLDSDGGQTNFDNVRLDASPVTKQPGDQFAISVLNSSFEQPGNGPGGFGGVIPGWTDGDGAGTQAGTFNPTTSRYPLGLSDGDDVAFSNSPVISQVLGDVLEADRIYTLEVDVGDRNDTNFPGFDVELLAGGNVLGGVDETSLAVPNGGFATAVVNFEVLPGDPNIGLPLEIRLSTNGGQTNFDNVRLTAIVTPEPASIAIWTGLGLLICAMGLIDRRRNS